MSNTRHFAEITNLRDKLRRGLAMLTVASMLMPSGGLASEGTNQGKLKCILPEHTHSEACYETAVICGEEERQPEIVREFTGTFPVHVHKADCYDSEGKLICGMVEKEYYHTHGEFCHDTEGNLVCGLQSQPKHSHTEDCRDGEGNLICGLNPDWPVFTTSAENWKETVKDPGHQHTEACYETKLICGLEEHTHTDECYETVMPVSAVSDELQEEKKDQTKPEGDDSGENEETDLEKIEVGLEKTVEEVADFISGHEEDQNDADQNPENAGKSSEELEQTEVENENPVKDKAETDEEPTVPQENGQEEEREKEPKEEEPKEEESGDGVTGEGEPEGVEPEDKVTGSEEPGSGEKTGKEEPAADGEEVNPLNPTPTDGAVIIETEQNPEGQPVEQVQTPEKNAEQEIEKIENQGTENPEASPEQNPDKQEPADEEAQADEQEPADEEAQADEQEPADEEAQADEQEPADEEKQADVVNPDGDPSDGERADEETEPVEEPVKFFEGTKVFEGPDYTVTATIGADACFPEDIELAVREILPGTDEYRMYSGQTADAATDEWSEIGEFARFFDITFLSGGAEVEPQAFIDVQITFREAIPVAEDADVQAIHFSEDGANVIESSTDSVEAAASDPDAVDTVNFTVDSFSVYGFFQRVVITTRVITAGGQTYRVEVTYGQDAGIPEGAVLSASEIRDGDEDYELYRAQAAAALEAGHVEMPGLYDISILDAEGQKVQPQGPVSVSITLENGLESEDIKVVHFPEGIEAARTEADGAAGETEEEEKRVTEETPEAAEKPVVAVEVISAEVSEQTVTFETDGFSVYALAYTVDFHYGNEATGEKYEYSILGGGVISLKTLLTALNIQDFAADEITEVHFSSEELVLPVKVEEDTTAGELKNRLGLQPSYSAELTEESIAEMDALALTAPDWALISLAPFKTDEELVITLVNGARYVIAVTDGQIVRYYIDSRGDTYEISLIYEDDAGIPDTAVLDVEEILPESEAFAPYLDQAMNAVGEAENKYARFFDITIRDGSEKVYPKAPVTVKMELTDAPAEEEFAVIHFDETEGPAVLDAQMNETGNPAAELQFRTDSFSVYGVIARPGFTGADDLAGKTMIISREGRYLTNQTVTLTNGDSTTGIGKGSESNAAVWLFEYPAGTVSGNEYYISTIVNGQKQYLNFIRNDSNSNRAHAQLSANPQRITVTQSDSNFRISVSLNNTTYYLDEHNGSAANGFAGWYQQGNNNKMSLVPKDPVVQPGDQYILLTRYEGEFYVILNDGTLVRTRDPENGVFKIDDPMVWQYNGKNLYHKARETGFDGNQLASDYFYRYLDPDANSGLTDENYDSTTGHVGNNATEYFIDSRPLQDQIQIVYNNYQISSKLNPSNYIGITHGTNGLQINGTASADQAAEIYFVKMTDTGSLVNAQNRVNDASHTVNHIDISIVGHAAFSIPLAYGTYYYKDQNGSVRTLIVNRENPVTVEVVQDVPIDKEDVKRANISAFTIGANGEHNNLDNVFYITGYSGNAENDASTNQTRIEGVFKVADRPNIGPDSRNWSDGKPVESIRKERLNHIIYYTISTTKRVTFDLSYNNMKLYNSYDAAASGVEDGTAQGSATVTLGQTLNYWDFNNECPPIGWDRPYWESGGIAYGWDDKTGSGMDFQLGTVDKDKYGVLAIEITKYILDTEGNPITPKYDINNVFHVYMSDSDGADSVSGVNVDTFSSDYTGYNTGYVRIHDKSVTVGAGGIGTVYDYDVDGGMVYIEEENDEVSLPRSIEDTEGKQWTYQKTYLETEYVWRDNGIVYRRHVSREYNQEDEAYRSIPEVLGNYKDVNGVDQYNGFLEFFVYNVYEAEPIDITVRKNWKHENGSYAEAPEDASIRLTVGRYRLVEDTENPVSGDLVIHHGITVQQEILNGRYYATYNVKQGNKVFRSASYALDSGNLNPIFYFTNLPAGDYTLEIKESVNGYTAQGTVSSFPVSIAAGHTVDSGNPAEINVCTTLTPAEERKMITIHVTNSQGGSANSPNSTYQNVTYTFPAGRKIVFTIFRPAGAYQSQADGFKLWCNGQDVPWPTGLENPGAWVHVNQDWVYQLPDQEGDLDIKFVNNWGETKCRILAVSLENKETTSAPGRALSQDNSSNRAAPAGNNLQTQSGLNRASLSNVSPTGAVPQSGVPGMKYEPDPLFSREVILANGLWQDAITELPAVDEHGHQYLYYIQNMDEQGLPENTNAVINLASDGRILTSDGDTVLEATNTIPDEKPKITIKKVDDNGYPLPGARFQITGDNETKEFTIDSSNASYTTEELEDGHYSVNESAAPEGYQAISGFSFSVENKKVVPQGTLPDGVAFDGENYTFTVRNIPSNDGRLRILKRWLDFYGNAGQAGPGANIKIIQLAQDLQPQHIVRVEFYYWNNSAWVHAKMSNEDNPPDAGKTFIGRGTLQIDITWDKYTEHVNELTIDGLDTFAFDQSEKKHAMLSIPASGNEKDTYIVRIKNYGYDPFNDGGASISGSFPNENTAAESYSLTGGTKTVHLNAGNSWSQQFNLTGVGKLTESSDTLPKYYDQGNGRECRYMIIEEPIPNGYSVSYSDNNIPGIGLGDVGTITAYNRSNTASITLVKVDQKNRQTRLTGAKFNLYMLENNQAGAVRLDDAAWQHKEVTTGTDGTASFSGLPYGYYELIETEAPVGYVIGETNSFYFKLSSDGLTRIKKDDEKHPSRWSYQANDSMMAINGSQITVGNTPDVREIEVTKEWLKYGDSTWPEGAFVTVGLYNGETAVINPEDSTNYYTVELSKEKPSGEFKGVPKYDSSGTEINYTVQEIGSNTENGKTRITTGTGDATQTWTVMISGDMTNGYRILNTQDDGKVFVRKTWYDAYGNPAAGVKQKITAELYKLVENGNDVKVATQEIDPESIAGFDVSAYITEEEPNPQFYVKETSAFTGYETRYAAERFPNSRDESQNDPFRGETAEKQILASEGGTLYIMNTATKTGMQVVMHKKWIEFQDPGMTFYLGQLDGFTTNTDAARKYMKLDVELYYDAVAVDGGTKLADNQKVTNDRILLWEQNTSGQTFPTLQLTNNIAPGQTLYLNYIGDWEWGFRENTGSGQAGGPGNLPEYGYLNGQLVHYVYHFEEVAIYDGSTHTSNGNNYNWDNPENVTDQWWKLWQNPISDSETQNGNTVGYTRTNIENRPKKLPVEKKWYKEGDNYQKVLADENDLQAIDSITVKLMISFDEAANASATWYEGAELTLTKTGDWKGCFEDLDQIVAQVIANNHLSNDPRKAKYRIDEVWNEAFKPEQVDITDHEAQLNNILMPRGSIKVRKRWTVEDPNAAAVLLKLRRVSNNQVEDEDAMADVYAHPTKYGLTADNIYTDSTGSYIRIAKDENGEWPELTITNLLIKRAMNDGQAPMDCYYFVDEAGYLTSTAEAKADIPGTWSTPVYSGGENHGGTFGTGAGHNPLLTVAPLKSNPSTLTVTNSMNSGSLSLTKQIEAGNTESESFIFQVVLTPPTGVTIDANVLNLSARDDGSITARTKEESTGVVTLTVQINNASAGAEKTVTITGIPAGTTYEVTEPAENLPSGWYQVGETEYSDETRTIGANETDRAAIKNTKGISINVTKLWTKDGAARTDRTVITFTLYQVLTPADGGTSLEPTVYSSYGTNGVGTVNYSAETGWETIQIPNLPMTVTREVTTGEGDSALTASVTYHASYYVIEEAVQADAGYVLETRYSNDANASADESASKNGAEKSVNTNGSTITIINTETAGVELPATGGPGTLIFTSFGLALMILAGVLMISRKRKLNR